MCGCTKKYKEVFPGAWQSIPCGCPPDPARQKQLEKWYKEWTYIAECSRATSESGKAN